MTQDLTFWPAGALASHDFGIPSYLVAPIIPSAGLVLLHGKREVGKTQLALTLALSVMSGSPFLGLYDTTPGPALLFQVDMQPTMTQDRVRKLPESGLAVLTSPARVDIITQKISPSPALRDAQALRPSIVIIDSLRKIHDYDENDSNAPTRVYSACRDLFPGSTIVLIHHDRKDGEFTDPAGDEAFRGSGAWLDEPDTGLHLVRTKGDGGGLRLYFSKARTCEKPDPLLLKMRPDTLLLELASKKPEHYAEEFLKAKPKASRKDVVNFVMKMTGCKDTAAYTAVTPLWTRLHPQA